MKQADELVRWKCDWCGRIWETAARAAAWHAHADGTIFCDAVCQSAYKAVPSER